MRIGPFKAVSHQPQLIRAVGIAPAGATGRHGALGTHWVNYPQ